ncbi:MAG TPA: dATP/dGTP diphosphohydrolase domain-containing protein [Vicinamibacterales bacterium]
MNESTVLPTDKQARKDTPVCSGVLDYFPAALAEIARVSKAGNDQHNPGQPLHWARGKANDHSDCIVRHLMERGTIDDDGQRHSAKMAWRALALLQEELEAEGAPMARGGKSAEVVPIRPVPPQAQKPNLVGSVLHIPAHKVPASEPNQPGQIAEQWAGDQWAGDCVGYTR